MLWMHYHLFQSLLLSFGILLNFQPRVFWGFLGFVFVFGVFLFFVDLHMAYSPGSTGKGESVQTKQGENEHKTLNFIKHCVTGKD